MAIYWRVYGYAFWSHWVRARNRLDHYDWYHKFHIWLRFGGKKALINQPIRYALAYFFGPDINDCPHCGYGDWTEHHDLFECLESGTGMNDYGTTHWWRGVQTCARCGVGTEYGDSN